MSNRKQEILSVQLASIDRRRAELECMMTTLPPDYREDFEDELRDLWVHQVKVAEQLTPTKSR